ncbi:unnamed protein product [Vitrella brassicaformis CCMP3155]|uniref:Uncharacterized protein n=1 Tax=Vitrella brassicaformis (strain CCMP3155) TaxID=1169540 RepID=A0A0G4EHP3_VITBC|nr:unnamed protein product [Vitrella brassicaformis CCMP3155]|eukprot:CEL95535.1 unnamed protein product [Vitrella brassicaformis CCMP3155]
MTGVEVSRVVQFSDAGEAGKVSELATGLKRQWGDLCDDITSMDDKEAAGSVGDASPVSGGGGQADGPTLTRLLKDEMAHVCEVRQRVQAFQHTKSKPPTSPQDDTARYQTAAATLREQHEPELPLPFKTTLLLPPQPQGVIDKDGAGGGGVSGRGSSMAPSVHSSYGPSPARVAGNRQHHYLDNMSDASSTETQIALSELLLAQQSPAHHATIPPLDLSKIKEQDKRKPAAAEPAKEDDNKPQQEEPSTFQKLFSSFLMPAAEREEETGEEGEEEGEEDKIDVTEWGRPPIPRIKVLGKTALFLKRTQALAATNKKKDQNRHRRASVPPRQSDWDNIPTERVNATERGDTQKKEDITLQRRLLSLLFGGVEEAVTRKEEGEEEEEAEGEGEGGPPSAPSTPPPPPPASRHKTAAKAVLFIKRAEALANKEKVQQHQQQQQQQQRQSFFGSLFGEQQQQSLAIPPPPSPTPSHDEMTTLSVGDYEEKERGDRGDTSTPSVSLLGRLSLASLFTFEDEGATRERGGERDGKRKRPDHGHANAAGGGGGGVRMVPQPPAADTKKMPVAKSTVYVGRSSGSGASGGVGVFGW